MMKSKAKEEFSLEQIGSEQMRDWIGECINIYQGNPSWLDEEDHIDTVNFAKSVCSEVARLATLGIGIHLDGSARANWLQEQIDRIYFQLRNWVEYGCAYGTIILKPNGGTVDLYTPDMFEIVHATADRIDGVIFHHWKQVGEKWYTRLEYHRFEDEKYLITNKCYLGERPDDTKHQVAIESTPWDYLAEEVAVVFTPLPMRL
jgi:hypothetical protein